jgi:hypothetical protein
LLLNYLLRVQAPFWPGSDGLTTEEVLLSYPRYAEAGLVPNREELLARHADLADEVDRFFAEHQS